MRHSLWTPLALLQPVQGQPAVPHNQASVTVRDCALAAEAKAGRRPAWMPRPKSGAWSYDDIACLGYGRGLEITGPMPELRFLMQPTALLDQPPQMARGRGVGRRGMGLSDPSTQSAK